MNGFKGEIKMSNSINEGRIIRNKLTLYGYEKGRIPIIYTPSLTPIAREIIKLPENTTITKFSCRNLDVFEKAKEILNSHFILHKVPYLQMDRLNVIMQDVVSSDGTILSDKLGEVISKIKESSTLVSPYDLPVKLEEGHSMVGKIEKPMILISDDNFLRNCPITFGSVVLGNNITKLSTATYGHELIHTQLESIKGSCTNYHNREVVSIFIEKLMAVEMDPSGELLRKSEEMRFRDLAENLSILYSGDKFTRTELVEASVYANSILKATHLFDRYVNGDANIQKSILTGIQNIFDGKSTVEKLLENNNITFENSTNLQLVKKHLR